MAHRLACWRRRKRGTNDTALEFGKCQTWMVVLLATIREIHETQQIHEINENPDWQVHEIHEIQRQKKGKKPLLLNSYSSHLFRPFSYAGAQHGVNLCESAPLGAFIWFQYLKIPPGTSQQFPIFIHLVSKTSPLASKQLFCMHLNLVSMSKLPLVSQQLLALIYLVSIPNFSPGASHQTS